MKVLQKARKLQKGKNLRFHKKTIKKDSEIFVFLRFFPCGKKMNERKTFFNKIQQQNFYGKSLLSQNSKIDFPLQIKKLMQRYVFMELSESFSSLQRKINL